jgi:hypothetical protein
MGQLVSGVSMLGLSSFRFINFVGPFKNSCTAELLQLLNSFPSPVRPRFGRTFCHKDKRVPFGLVATPLSVRAS